MCTWGGPGGLANQVSRRGSTGKICKAQEEWKVTGVQRGTSPGAVELSDVELVCSKHSCSAKAAIIYPHRILFQPPLLYCLSSPLTTSSFSSGSKVWGQRGVVCLGELTPGPGSS